MTGTYSKMLLGCFLIIALIARVKPQQAPQQAGKESAATSPQTSAPAQAQEQKPAPVYESATVLKSITRLVVVDVVATDKHGAVTDLQRDDFTILEDGKEQRVRVFNFQQPPVHVAANSPTPVKLPENVYSNVPRYSPSSALNVLLLDALNTNLPNQAYVRGEMIRYLEKMPEGQPVAVYMLGTKLTLLQDFTSDPAVLRNVVQQL